MTRLLTLTLHIPSEDAYQVLESLRCNASVPLMLMTDYGHSIAADCRFAGAHITNVHLGVERGPQLNEASG